MKKPKRKPRHDAVIAMRIGGRDRKLMDRCARLQGLSLSSWVRMHLLAVAHMQRDHARAGKQAMRNCKKAAKERANAEKIGRGSDLDSDAA